jgi:hypothetical protein
MPKPKLEPGSVLELVANGGFVYLQYIGEHRYCGEAVVVKPGIQPRTIAFPDDYFADGFVAFYLAGLAVRSRPKRATIVGRLPAPEMPARVRLAGQDDGRLVRHWIIDDGSFVAHPVVRKTLTDAEARLPIAGIWGHPYLLARVAEGWRPEYARLTRNDLQQA